MAKNLSEPTRTFRMVDAVHEYGSAVRKSAWAFTDHGFDSPQYATASRREQEAYKVFSWLAHTGTDRVVPIESLAPDV